MNKARAVWPGPNSTVDPSHRDVYQDRHFPEWNQGGRGGNTSGGVTPLRYRAASESSLRLLPSLPSPKKDRIRPLQPSLHPPTGMVEPADTTPRPGPLPALFRRPCLRGSKLWPRNGRVSRCVRTRSDSRGGNYTLVVRRMHSTIPVGGSGGSEHTFDQLNRPAAG
jgi:hypothetical protein